MRNKRLTLADAMRTLIVTIKNDGYELKSIAGKAFYGVSGIRGKVEGIPEYFPISLSVKDESNPAPKVEQSKASRNLDEQASAQRTQASNAGESITSLASGLDKAKSDIIQRTFSSIGVLSSLPVVELTGAANDVLYALFFHGALASGDLPAKSGAAELRSLGFAETGHVATKYQGEDYFTWLTPAGQAFAIGYLAKIGKSQPKPLPYGLAGNYQEDSAPLIESARIRDSVISSGRICGNTIEQETLSGVLTNTLHNVNPKEASDVALKLATAVKSAFNKLAGSSDGQDASLSSESVFSCDIFRLHRTGEMQMASPLATKTQPGHEADKTAGAINLKLELDIGDICKQIDEAYEELTERIKAANQWSDIAGLQVLSNRVSRLEAALTSQGSQITELQAKHARTS